MQDRLATSEIVAQSDALAGGGIGAPSLFVLAKNPRVGESEPVNALLHVAHQKTVRFSPAAADRFDDLILGLLDVLVFIHENVVEVPPPLLRRRRRPAGGRVAEEAKGKLLDVGEIDAAQLAFGPGELRAKRPRQLQQRDHVRPYPIPILGERIALLIRNAESAKR